MLSLLEDGSASDVKLNREDYTMLHTFSIKRPDMFWRKVAGHDREKGWPQHPPPGVQERNHRHLFFIHHDEPPLQSLETFWHGNSKEPTVEFMKGTKTNMCYNLLDRHVNNPELRNRKALI